DHAMTAGIPGHVLEEAAERRVQNAELRLLGALLVGMGVKPPKAPRVYRRRPPGLDAPRDDVELRIEALLAAGRPRRSDLIMVRLDDRRVEHTCERGCRGPLGPEGRPDQCLGRRVGPVRGSQAPQGRLEIGWQACFVAKWERGGGWVRAAGGARGAACDSAPAASGGSPAPMFTAPTGSSPFASSPRPIHPVLTGASGDAVC